MGSQLKFFQKNSFFLILFNEKIIIFAFKKMF